MKRLLALTAVLVGLSAAARDSHAVPFVYVANLDGPSEAVPNLSPGTGFAKVEIDVVAHTLFVHTEFQDLLGPVTASHIHAATAVPGVGTAGVATMLPTFTGFPGGVTAGIYDHLFFTNQASTFNPAFVSSQGGGTLASAEAAFAASLAAGTSYLNIHTQTYPGGEIRGFLRPAVPESPTIGLLAVGLLGLLATRSRARQ